MTVNFPDMFSDYFVDFSQEDRVAALASILYAVEDGIVVANGDKKFILWNPAATRILGLSMTEDHDWSIFYGCYHEDGLPYSENELPLVRAIVGIKTDKEVMYIKNPQKNEGMWLSITGIPLPFGGLVVFRDITNTKTAVDGLQQIIANHEKSLASQQHLETPQVVKVPVEALTPEVIVKVPPIQVDTPSTSTVIVKIPAMTIEVPAHTVSAPATVSAPTTILPEELP